MVLFYKAPFLDANDLDEVGDKETRFRCEGLWGKLALFVKDEASLT
jgi:hypothetical protein